MVPASSALGVNKLDNVEKLAIDEARPVARDALSVLANYSPDIASEQSETIASPTQTAKKSKPPFAPHKPTKIAHLHEAAVLGLALIGVGVGYGAWRLSEGTISIAAAKPLVEDALERISGGQTNIGSLRLGWDKTERKFVVTADQITAVTNARTSPLALGQVTLTMNGPALLLGQTQISRADISGLKAVLVLDKDGAMAFGFGTLEEVLALPRKKPVARGLRATLDNARQALLLNKKNGRIDTISLRNAQLTIIDPDTGERLSLENTSANLSTDKQDLLLIQISGRTREMGGHANLAIASLPDPSQKLAVAARFDNLRLSQLPSSLRIGTLARTAHDNAAISGSGLVYLGRDATDTDVKATFGVTNGQIQGFEIGAISGQFDWRGGQSRATLTNLNASGRGVSFDGASGTLDLVAEGRKALVFAARRFRVDDARIGNFQSSGIRGSLQLAPDNLPTSGALTGQTLSFSRAGQASINAKDFTLTVSPTNTSWNTNLRVDLSASAIDGQVNGEALDANGVKLEATLARNGMSIAPLAISAKASSAQYDVALAGVRQSFDARGLILDARGFSTGPIAGRSFPGDLTLRAGELTFGRGQSSPFVGSATNVNLTVIGARSSQGRYQGTVSAINARYNGARPSGIEGRAISFDIAQTNKNTGRVNSLEAASLSISGGGGTATTNALVANGNFNGTTFTNAKLSASNAQITHESQLVRPFWADNLRLAGNFTPRSATLDMFSLSHRGVDISGNTQIALAPRGSPSVKLDADVRGAFSVETLLSAWPMRFLPETRKSIQRLIPAGIAEVSRLELAIPAGMAKKQVLPKNGMALDFTLRDVTVTYLRGMSAITGVRGTGQLLGDSLYIDLPQGRIGDVALSEGTVEIAQFMPSGARLTVGAKAVGNVTDMANEIDLPPLAVLTNAGLSADRLSGNGNARVDLDIPLKPVLAPNDIGVRVVGDFQQAGLSRTFAGLDAYNGIVRLGVNNQKVEVSGMAWLAGNLFDFDWYRDPSAMGESQVSLNATGLVTIDSLQAIGIDARAYASGPFQIDIESSSQGAELGEALLTANLDNTTITLPGNLWNKIEGVDAVASAKLYPREGGGWNVQDLRFDSKGAILRGALDITDEAKLVDARFSRFVIDNTADLSVDVTPSADALTVTLRGAYLNLSPYLAKKNVSEQAVDLLDRPLTLSADVARVATGPGRELTDVHADIVRDQEGWRTLEAAGSAPAGRSQISLNMQRDGRRTISGVLSDAGFFAQLLYPGAPLFGGTGVIEGELPVVGANSSGSLTFTGKDIQLVRDNTSPVLFDNVELPMSVRGGVVTLRDGQADGAAYTVKASGYVDVGAGRLDVRGVATPGGLNRVLADIPLFGAILGGGEDEGLLGMTFTARGLLTGPKLQTNPISALAPGFLRKLFESEAPLSPQPRLLAVPFVGVPLVTKWPYGPTEDMSERPNENGGSVGPTQ